MDLFVLQKELAAIPGVSGGEGDIIARLAELVRPLADTVTVDTLGNLIAHKKGPGPRLLVSAHADTAGLLITHIDPRGFLRFGLVGAVRVETLPGARVLLPGGVRGVCCLEGKEAKAERMFIDIGAVSRAEAEARVKIGDRACFAGETLREGSLVVSPHLGGRAGCVILLEALARLKKPAYDLHIVFSVQQEVGLRGARTAAFAVEPALALSVDVTEAGDVPGGAGELKLGGGPAIKLLDKSAVCHPRAIAWLEAAAKNAQLPAQREVAPDGMSDAGALVVSRGGVVTGGVSLPVRYRYSPVETAHMGDMEQAARLLAAALETPLA